MEEKISKRMCRKCGKIIPNRFIINNKIHSLQNRKFCLECSPFQKHNTSRHDPIKRVERVWNKYSKEQKDCVKMANYKRGLERRRNFYILKGGKCEKCGYNKCERALTFHHRDPSTKLFGLSLNNLWAHTDEEILLELGKCDLLCMNCHAEVEDEIARKTSIVSKINDKYGTDY